VIRFLETTPRPPVADLARAIEFYALLGFRLDVLWPEESPTFAIVTRDATSVGFFTPTPERPGRIGDAELYVRVSGAAALHAEVGRRVAVEWGPEVYSYGRREFAVRDPDGYPVIFTEPTDEPPTTHEP